MNINIPDDPFGLKVAVGGAVELVKARWLPVLSARGEARAALVKARGEIEVRKLENQLAVVGKAEQLLRDREITPHAISDDAFANVLDGAGRASDSTLQEMWAELLATAASTNRFDTRLQTFSNVLTQLSAGDAALIKLLIDLIPRDKGSIHIIRYYLNYDGKGEQRELSCSFTLSKEDQNLLSSQHVFSSDDELGDIVFSLYNLRRLGIVAMSDRMPWVIQMSSDQFSFSYFGQWMLQSVGVLQDVDVEFSDLELLDKLVE